MPTTKTMTDLLDSRCHTCDSPVSTLFLSCSICSNLFHLKCVRVPNNSFREEKLHFSNWFCSQCSCIFPFSQIPDIELKLIQSSFDPNTPIDIFSTVTDLSDLDFDNEISQENFLSSINPDSNLYSKTTKTCKYYSEKHFATKLQNINGLSLIHFNARSLNSNCEKIENYLKLTNHSFDVIAISETWHDNSSAGAKNNPKLANFLIDYLEFNVNRKNNQRGGGVSIFVNKGYSCKLISDMSAGVENLFECVTVELTLNRGEKTVISCIYRKPSTNIPEFTTHIEQIFSPATCRKMYICGDFNIDLLKYNDHEPTKNFVDSLFSIGFFPLITKPTRITDTSATLIDNIYTNQLDTEHHSGIFITDVSDHLPIFSISTKNFERPRTETQCHTTRRVNTETVDKLRRKLASQDWSNVLNTEDVNIAYNDFISIFSEHLNDCCPEITMKSKTNPSKPWLTDGLINACKKKNNLYKIALKTKRTIDKNRYKRIKTN